MMKNLILRLLQEGTNTSLDGNKYHAIVVHEGVRSWVSEHVSQTAAAEAIQKHLDTTKQGVGYVEQLRASITAPEAFKGNILSVHLPGRSFPVKPFDAKAYKESHAAAEIPRTYSAQGRPRDWSHVYKK